jgi:perosamine synthetase
VIPIAKPSISRKEIKAVTRVLKSGKLTQGDEVKRFEVAFSHYVGGRESVAVNSGTSGLHLALLASGIGKGDEVIVPSFTFAATANTVALTGATPVFVDIDLDTFNISPKSIESAITARTKAIQPVHLYGLPANMVEISRIAQKYDLVILEDAAQAHLASIEGISVGQFGEMATFSFYPTKNMTSGEGGMIVCKTEAMSRYCRLLRNQGMERKYHNEIVGYNARMTDIHAAIGLVQLSRLSKWTRQRQENASFYDANLVGVITPTVPVGYKHVYHQYTVRVVGFPRDEFVGELQKRGVETAVYYPTPCNLLPSFYSVIDLPNTSQASKEVLSIPVHPMLSKGEKEFIVETMNAVASSGA